MKSTLSDNKQLFNVKAIANAGLAPSAIPANTWAVVNEATNTTVALSTYAALPDEFRFVSKLDGETYHSFEAIKKVNMLNQKRDEYADQAINIWETTIEYCNCIEGIVLHLNLDEHSLIQRDGLTWTHSDFAVEVAPSELTCLCDCSGQYPVYENNIMTKILNEKIADIDSPFYESEIHIDITGYTTYADIAALDTAVTAPDQGDIYIVTAVGLVQSDGTAGSWDTIGTIAGVITDVDTFIENNRVLNTDSSTTNDKEYLIFVIKGKEQASGLYRDLEVNYIYPRGVRLVEPTIRVNSDQKTITFTETQELAYEIGAGYDLRAEEFECNSLYTNLNGYPQLSDGIQNPELIYQFENNTDYDTFVFEFDTEKVERAGSANMRRFSVLIASSDSSIIDDIATALTA